MLQGFTSTSYHFNLNLFCIIITDHRNLQQSSQGTRTLVYVKLCYIVVFTSHYVTS